jgi:hypothetical protein
MGKGWWTNTWIKQLVVAIGYVGVYELAHPFSPPEFALGSALRLIFLLFMPYRYWLALAVGEALPNFQAVYPCLAQFGLWWVVVRSIPPIAVMMPVVWFCRSRLVLFPNKRLVNIKTLLVAVLGSSLVLTGYSSTAMVLAHLQPNTLPLTPDIACCYFIGFYFAMLALVPWALIARFEHREGQQWRDTVQRALRSRLLAEGMSIMLPATLLLVLASYRSNIIHPQFILMAMFLPVAWLTLRHGWRAAAFGGTITIICAAAAFPSEAYDANIEVIQTELFLAVTITSLFALGARISAHLQQVRQASSAKHLARESYLQSEYRRREAAQTLEKLSVALHLTSIRWLRHLRSVDPSIESETYYQEANDAHKHLSDLAESLHPLVWRSQGLTAALQETVRHILADASITYSIKIVGHGFTRMQPTVLAATYRAACEAIAYAGTRVACSSIRVTLRGGETHGSRWVFVGVEGVMDHMKIASAIFHAEARQQLASKLGVQGFTMKELCDHVRLFDGDLHDRSNERYVRITMLLYDARRVSHEEPAPLRLWVH